MKATRIATFARAFPNSVRGDSPMRLRLRPRGAMLVFAAGMMMILLLMAAFTVDVAYMQLTRTELRAATDAAAKAGCEALLRMQDPAAGALAATEIAAENFVAGNPLLLAGENIEFGRSSLQPDGSWLFTAGEEPFQAVRVHVQMGTGQVNGPVSLLMGNILGVSSFSPTATSVASEMEQELCFCLDRSHSMCWDLSGADWQYPPPITSPQGQNLPPHATASRWAALVGAADEFISIYSGLDTNSHLAVVTWASESTSSGVTSPAASLDGPLGTPADDIHDLLAARFNQAMRGATNLSAGIDLGVSTLTGPGTRPLAHKVLIVMTDGQWNSGRDPLDAARDAHAAGVTIHTVTFLPNTSQDTMIEIASITGGKHHYASDAAALRQVFRELALSLPVVLTQ